MILLIDYELNEIHYTDKNGKDKIKTELTTERQELLPFYIIQHMTKKIIYPPNITYTEVKDLTKIQCYSNRNTYIQAPVGSGKSRSVLSRDIINVMKNDPNNRILMITDTRVLATKQVEDILQILTSIGCDPSCLLDYRELTRENPLEDKHRFIVVCYDSLIKFNSIFKKITHIFIDEFCNVMKRTYGANEEMYKKIDRFNDFLTLIQNKTVKLYDADFEPNDMSFCKIKLYKLIGFKQPNNTSTLMKETYAYDCMLELLRQRRKIVCIITSKTKMKEFEIDILSKIQNIRILSIDNEGAYDTNPNAITSSKQMKILKEQVIRNTDLWQNYDLVIYTPTIQTGVSFNDTSYFYKTFAFLALHTTDAQQTTQMLFRVRANITGEIIFAVFKNAIKSIKYTEINTAKNITQNNNNFNLMIENTGTSQLHSGKKGIITPYYNTNLETPTPTQKPPQISQGKDTCQLLVDKERTDSITKDRKLLHDIFKTMYNWGVDNLKCNYYKQETTETFCSRIANEVIDTVLNFMFQQSEIDDCVGQTVIECEKPICRLDFEKQQFYSLEYTSNFEKQNEDDYYIQQKFYALNNLNYTCDIWTHISTDEDDDNINKIDKLYFEYNSETDLKIFNKLSNISFYCFKPMIDFLYENSFLNKKSMYEYISQTKNTYDINVFVKRIFGMYIAFNVFEIIKITRTELEELYMNETVLDKKGDKIPKCIIFNKLEYKLSLETAYQKNMWLFQYIITTNTDIDCSMYSFYSLAFKQIGLVFNINKDDTFYSVKLHYTAKHYRFQQPLILNHTLPSGLEYKNYNEVDDICYWYNNTDTIQFETKLESGLEPIIDLPINMLPKLLTFQFKNILTLKTYYDVFGSDNKKLEFETLFTDFTEKSIHYNNITPVKLHDNLMPILNSLKDKQNKLKQSKIEAIETKKQQTKAAEEADVKCECGGKYKYRQRQTHFQTAKHKKYILECETPEQKAAYD